MTDRYPEEFLDPELDDGTMPANVAALEEQIIGRRIVTAEPAGGSLVLTLDNGRRVTLAETYDCCAYTQITDIFLDPAVADFFRDPSAVDHVILGVGTTDGYTTWHIYADFGDVMRLSVGWSSGNPFYYGYGFDISVMEPLT